MVKCLDCGEIFEDDEIIQSEVGLSDDPWGAGESWIYEYSCPACGGTEIEDYFENGDFETDDSEDEEEDDE